MAGAPKGNTNGRMENRLWGDTLRRALKQSDSNKLRVIAEKLIDMAAEGDIAAIKELGARLDGKSKQQTELTGAHGGPIKMQSVEVAIIDSKD